MHESAPVLAEPIRAGGAQCDRECAAGGRGAIKARAADILGIGRTTLYRKMRTLKIDAGERMTAPGR